MILMAHGFSVKIRQAIFHKSGIANPGVAKPGVANLGIAMLLVLLTSCSQMDTPTPGDQAVAMLEQEAALSAPAVPEEVSAALLATSEEVAPEVAEERFDISVNQVAARAFFLGLVKDTGHNIVVHPDVAGAITLELSHVTIEDVLKICRDIYGYEYKLSNGIYTIFPSALRTEIFPINYLDVKRVGLSDTNVQVGSIESRDNNNNRGRNSNYNSRQEGVNLLDLLDESEGNNRQRSAVANPGARVQTLTRTDFWSALQKAVTALIGGLSDGRDVTVTPQAGLVIVKALPNELQNVRDFLERSSLSVKRQVLLEAKVVEVRLSDEFNTGINWNAISGELQQWHNVQGIDSDGGITVNESLDDTFFSVLQVNSINELLDLLASQGSVQVLSSPRIATVNNQKAVIRVGSDEFFVTGLSSDTTTSTSGDNVVNSPDIELTPFFSGIALDVTPQIAESGEIVLHIHPVITEVSDQVKAVQIGDQTFNFPLAFRDIRESDSVVKAQSGQVIVLGGLMQEVETQRKGKRPLIGDVPLVGNALFRTRNNRKVKTELVILLKPTIVDADSIGRELRQSRDRLKSMGDIYRETF